ncbi:MAG: CotH kinase family protein [Verrucomicrobia bacterium]|nr:CotH kinase family protein [Verrucomicrobiota bacterium]
MSAPRPRSRPLSPAAFGGILAGALVLAAALAHRELLRPFRSPELVISEIMAVNRVTVTDADDEPSDWIEVHNPGAEPRDLGGWSLTDDFRSPRKWTFPPVQIAPGGFLVVFASGKDRSERPDDLHTSFRLNPKGEYLALIHPDGHTVDEYLPKYPAMESDVSFGRRAAGAQARGIRRHAFFVQPTPGRTNGAELQGRVARVQFSERRGLRSEPVQIALTCATPGADIWYTTNGAAPQPGTGHRYASPLTVNDTTTLRAAAFREGFRPADPTTQTYIFPSRVPSQTGAGFPGSWGTRHGEPVTADYAMDPDIAGSPRYRERLSQGLEALPSLSLVLDPADLFDPATGLYSNPMESGAAWERPGTLELLPAEGARGFQVLCGVRIQGGWSRRPEESPKHSFRLEFRERYGAAALDQPLFGPGGQQRFESLVLRAGCNNSWLHWNGEERRRGDLLRDEFLRTSSRDIGEPAARGRFFHLYLNGLYWGIYNVCERPDAAFAAAHFGGAADDYESRNAGKVLSGDDVRWQRMFALANAGLEAPGAYEELRQLLNVEAFCAFLLIQIYGGTSDWDAVSNWYAARRIRPAGRHRFLLWDGERSLEGADVSILDADDDQSPTRLFQALRKHPEFRATFTSVARRHLGPGGALRPDAAAARYRDLADLLRPAIVAESARWGDYRRDVHPYREGPYELYTADDHWEREVDRLMQDYFPVRTGHVIRQLEAAGLY